MKDYYSILGVSQKATAAEIRTSYINRSKVLHPDRFDPQTQPKEWNLANEMMKELNEAFNVLKNADSRAKYDSTLNASGNRQHEKETHTESTKSETRTSSTKEQEPKPQKKNGATVIFFNDLPKEAKAFMLSWQSGGNGLEHYKIQSEGVIWKYVWAIGILFGFYILYIVAQDSQWSSAGSLFAFGLSCFCSVYFIRKTLWIYSWHNSELKCFYYLTPVYFIKTCMNEIHYWWAWDIVSMKPTEHYTNGIYQKTSVDIEFADATEHINFNSKKQWRNFFQALKDLEGTRLSAVTQKNWSWFEQQNIFHGVKGCTTQEIQSKNNEKKKMARFAFGASILIGGIFYLFVEDINKNYSTAEINSYASREAAPSPRITPTPKAAPVTLTPITFDKPAKPLPQNGYLARYSNEEPVAPLKILVPTGDTHYYAKIVKVNTNHPIATIFIRAGQQVFLKVPLGSYELKYAMGSTWYGTKYLFGPGTSVAKAKKVFDFTIEGDKVSGYTVELIKQQGGNLETSGLKLKDF